MSLVYTSHVLKDADAKQDSKALIGEVGAFLTAHFGDKEDALPIGEGPCRRKENARPLGGGRASGVTLGRR